MLSLSTITNSSPVPATVVPPQVTISADKVSTRVTPVAVTAPLLAEAVADKAAQAGRPVAQQQNVMEDTVAVSTQMATAQADAAMEPYSRFAPALQYNTLVGYGFVKYKPSDAGIPGSRNSSSQQVLSEQPMHVPQYQAYLATQTRNDSELAPISPPVIAAG